MLSRSCSLAQLTNISSHKPETSWGRICTTSALRAQSTAIRGSPQAQLLFGAQLVHLLELMAHELASVVNTITSPLETDGERVDVRISFWEAGVDACTAAMSAPDNVPNQQKAMAVLPTVLELASSLVVEQEVASAPSLQEQRILSSVSEFVLGSVGDNSESRHDSILYFEVEGCNKPLIRLIRA